MNFKQTAQADFNDAANVVIAFVGKEDAALSPLPKDLAAQVRTWREQQWISTKDGTVTPLLRPEGAQIMLVGTGDSLSLSENQLKKVAAALAQVVKQSRRTSVTVLLSGLKVKDRTQDWLAAHLVEWTLTSTYSYDTTKSEKNPEYTTEHFLLAAEGELAASIRHGKAVAHGVNVARELGNLPPNICTPTYLAEQAQSLADHYEQVQTDILEEAEMEKMGMGAFMAVSKGSDQPGKMIIMHYKGAGDDVKPHVLVGKGLTFDTGGISLKPAQNMDEMKYDMCGAASVFGTISTLAELQPKINVVAIVAAAENMPSARATRPGDVVTSLSGKTVEILNTDAEGRLVLCDALTYAERFEPQSVVNMATLTGAIVIGLGHHPIGLYSNDDSLQQDLVAAGQQAWDRAWPMPLWDDYREEMESPYADLRNIGQGRAGGSITAAIYLSEFTRNYKWAHLDIAGAAWTSAKTGATGRPVGLLTEYLLGKTAA
ncbi:leucyl aminopeptidase [Natronospirillum operosum]|uniref:Probable cytosol aminopeptidase n=1 Tax=Natronospirillum operosum TaxID=2759953 RepID=A0A4Z0WIY3_9GAMM|nr:leucyl aminopeptidase [Natronospirillum operosum]TGG95115.1 leucyl aminopeptidase [Natronospirillum operosum]